MDVLKLSRIRLAGCLVAADLLVWVASVALFCGLRLSAAGAPSVDWPRVLQIGVGAGLLHVVLGTCLALYRGRAPLGSLDEAFLLGSTVLLVGGAITAASVVMLEPFLPRSVPVAAACLTLAVSASVRAGLRRRLERRQERWARWKATPVLVVGAGSAARSVVESMLNTPDGSWRPLGLLEADPRRRHLRIRGVPVLGPPSRLAEIAHQTGAETLVIADPAMPSDRLQVLLAEARERGLHVKILPALADLPSGEPVAADLRDLNVEDLLGRHTIDTDIDSIAGYLTGRRVLVTGAGGSIGSELCRQINRFAPSELIMLDRDESALHAVQLSLSGRALLDGPEVVLADIRDRTGIIRIFEERQPEVVFHAAALKHLPMLEQYPGEAMQTNVWGTLTVLEAAAAVGVRRFVNVSTDKAADPVCTLGYSKRLAESLTASLSEALDGVYLSVRFGNVLGSRGSVLTTFAAQISGNDAVTVTHPDVTRYFMTIPEAVELVIQAAAIGDRAEVLVLDMGEPVRIVDVARQMMSMAGRSVPIEFTGLRPGEKLHEDLLARGEVDRRPRHPLVSQVPVPAIDTDLVRQLDARESPQQLIRRMAALCELVRPTGAPRESATAADGASASA